MNFPPNTVALIGCKKKDVFQTPECLIQGFGKYQPTTDPAAAMEVLKKCLAKDCEIRVCELSDKSIRIGSMESKEMNLTFSETLELAICLFAKKLFTK